jgi:NhaP-type Na+/H+ or K+/H+ antiporter
MSIVALSFILFDAGLDVNINTFLNETGKATGLAFTTILTVTPIVGIVINYLLSESFTLLQGMLLGSMIAGTSTVSIYGCLTYLSENLKNIEHPKALLIMSVLSDPTCIIL